eukprot:gene15947-22082_t
MKTATNAPALSTSFLKFQATHASLVQREPPPGENLHTDFDTFEKFAKAGGASDKLMTKDVINMGASQASQSRAKYVNLIVIKNNRVIALPLSPKEASLCTKRVSLGEGELHQLDCDQEQPGNNAALVTQGGFSLHQKGKPG